MSKKIGIEQSLSDVEAALKEKGYEVVTMKTEDDAKGCDCCVVTGLDTDMLGISDMMTGASVIQATGLTDDENCQQVEQKLQ